MNPETGGEAAFRHRHRQTLRFADVDVLGHVNNVAIFQLFETGRVAFLAERGLALGRPDITVVLARVAVDFAAELHWPGEVEVATRVATIGRTSFTLVQGLYHEGRRAASSEAVCVAVDRASGGPIGLPEWLRRALTEG